MRKTEKQQNVYKNCKISKKRQNQKNKERKT